MPLIDTSLRDILAAFSSPDPTPGGGSASALASALGASLLMMVAGLAKTRTGSADERTALAAAAPQLADLRDQLTRAVDADAAAYDRVVAAFKLPKASPDEQEVRKAAIQRALRAATDEPLKVMGLSAAALAEAETVAANGHTGAASDVGVALELLAAGLHGARLNVAINLDGNKDEGYGAAVRDQMEQRSRAAEASIAAAHRALGPTS